MSDSPLCPRIVDLKDYEKWYDSIGIYLSSVHVTFYDPGKCQQKTAFGDLNKNLNQWNGHALKTIMIEDVQYCYQKWYDSISL